MKPILPDVLEPGLKVVFCGTAIGHVSARTGTYYAGPGNRFWPVLYKIGLTPRLLAPAEFRLAAAFGIGLTNIVPHIEGMDNILRPADFDVDGLRRKIENCAPRAFAFNGKRGAQAFYGTMKINYGMQPEPLGETTVFVLPSTSGAAVRYWDEAVWQALADWLRGRG